MAITAAERIGMRVEHQEGIARHAAKDGREFAKGVLAGLREAQDVIALHPVATIPEVVAAHYKHANDQGGDAAMKRTEERVVADLRASVTPRLLFRAMLGSLEDSAREWMGDQGAACAYVVIRDGGPDFLLPGELLPGDILLSIVDGTGANRGEWMVRTGQGENEGRMEFHRGG